MLNLFKIVSLIFFFCLLCVHADPLNWDATKVIYPKARRSNTAFSYPSAKAGHNVTVGDPFNYMEQGTEKSSETKAFVEAQLALTTSYLNKNKDLSQISKSIKNLNLYAEIGFPQPFGPKKQYLYNVHEVKKSLATWYIASEEEMKMAYKTQFSTYPGKKWFDENLLNKNGTDQVQKMYPSPDGKYIAYLITAGGVEQDQIMVRETSSSFLRAPSKYIIGGTGRLPEVLPHGDGGDVFWTSDSQGFFYTEWLYPDGDPVKGYGSQIKYHRLNTEYEKDIIVAIQPKDPQAFFGLYMTGDMKWIIAATYASADFHNLAYAAPLDQPINDKFKWLAIRSKADAQFNYLACVGSTFYFTTDAEGAANIKVISVEVDKSKAKTVQYLSDLNDQLPIKTVIPEIPDASMDLITMYDVPTSFDQDKVLLWYVKEARDIIYVFSLITGKNLGEVLPQGHGTVKAFKTEQMDDEFFLSTNTINKPETIYRITVEKDSIQVQQIADSKVKGVDLDSIVFEQYFSTSKDGTKIPFYLFHKKGVKLDGTQPAWLFFYAAYGFSSLPDYEGAFVDFILHYNGVVIWSSPRGGGEEGAKWYAAAKGIKRQNTIDDIISVAQYAVDKKMAAAGKIVADAGSAGAMICMVVANQAPEGLLGGAMGEHGFYDLLRFSIIDRIGKANLGEFGDPQNGTEFDFLLGFSPLQNVKKGKKYPAIVLYTTSKDERVSPVEDYKMIAELQSQNPKNQYPMLLYIPSQGGHLSEYSSRDFLVETTATKQALMAQALGLKRS